MISTRIESLEQSARLERLTRWAAKLWAQPVQLIPLLLVMQPCPLNPTQKPVGHERTSANTCAHQGNNLDYLQGQARLTRPARDGSFRIHPSPDPFGRATRPRLPSRNDGIPCVSIIRPRHAGSALGRSVPAQLGSGPGQGLQRVGLPLHPTRTRPVRLRIRHLLA
jgi:hypothetical protein